MKLAADQTILPVQSDSRADTTLARIQRLEQLPVFPASATEIMSECNDPRGDVKKIIQLIECEPAIGTQVLSLVNSPLYGATRPIISIGQAVVLMGRKSISQMAIATAANAVFGEGDPAMKSHRDKAFFQSLSCATLARLLASQTGPNSGAASINADEAFLCGVMHDVGKLVFFKLVPDIYCEILQRDPSGQTIQCETERIGIGHAEVGRNCGVRWGLPPSINSVIADHHAPFCNCENPLAKTVMAANYFARRWQIGFAENETVPVQSDVEDMYCEHDTAAIKDRFTDQFAAVAEIYAA